MWRWYTAADREAVQTLHQNMEKRVGRTMDFPDLLTEPVVAAIVNEVDGTVTNCLFLEAEIECCALGDKALPAREVLKAIDEFLVPVARRYNIRIVRAFVPANILLKKNGKEGAVPRLLRKLGFTRENDTVVQFFRWLVPQDEEA